MLFGLLELVYYNSICLFAIFNIDVLLNRLKIYGSKESTRWFQLHAITNAIIAGNTLSDITECMQDSTKSIEISESEWARSFALSIHIYHCIAYNLRVEDWWHHIISVFMCAPLCVLNKTKAVSFKYFFCTGFPGGVDYLMLSLVRTNYITRITQKYIASILNAYIRMPGGCIGASLLLKDAFQPSGVRMDRVVLSVLAYGNSVYYGHQAIKSYGEANIINQLACKRKNVVIKT